MKQFNVTIYGEKVDPRLYTWDERSNTFCTNENNLDLDFTNQNIVLFKTGSYCTFKAGHNCIFDTAGYCTFETGTHCLFDTASNCTFKTGDNCTFVVGEGCKFEVGRACIVINRNTRQSITLNNRINRYDMKGKRINFREITVFKNDNDLEFSINKCRFKLRDLREFLSDKDLYRELEREIFDKFT